ncbi:MAG: gamma carbonic anhydrase family protein [Labilithrix sp.]|nr:gamma carbonic anhydrase family protein [Labilithrix sp.]
MTVYDLGDKRPVLSEGVFVAPNASVIGDVVVGASSSLWFGVVVRGDVFPIRIGARTNIQDNAVVHVTGGKASTTIGDDVTVGHLALVHGCTIGDRCLIGMGSIVLDGARIDDDCFIAAGSLVPPRMHVPARSVVMGRPGKVVREVTEADLVQIREAAALYVGYAREHGAGLRGRGG